MPEYNVSQTHFFRENGQKIEAGRTTELSEECYENYKVKHPGLLKPVRRTVQGSPSKVVRAAQRAKDVVTKRKRSSSKSKSRSKK